VPDEDPEQRLRGELRRLHFEAGEPTLDSLVGYVGLRRSRLTLGDVLVGRHRPTWGTLDAYIDACVQHANVHSKHLPAELTAKRRWTELYEAAYSTRGRPSGAAPSGPRLVGIEPGQADLLDRAISGLHSDLATLAASRDAAVASRFAQVTSQLALLMDRLEPVEADRAIVSLYLAALITGLDNDPWPQDIRYDGPRLTPATVERKLSVIGGAGRTAWIASADELAAKCTRLVILGGPGAGKTWLAKRAARLCAEKALGRLAAGVPLDEVELPLYTTCARLAATPSGDSIRRAVVSAALGMLPDLGHERAVDAVRVLFEARDSPSLLVADSLDEARGTDDYRLGQADSLPGTWRIVLTGRPGSWNRQIAIRDGDLYQQVGVLQPLRCPDDVEPFIGAWFAATPERAARLRAEISVRPALQQAATVPLILAFYCVIGGTEPLPSRRAGLLSKVIRRMLTGRWRGSTDQDLNRAACLETLRGWAWIAAEQDPISGVGTWRDEFSTERVPLSAGRLGPAEKDALNHVAVPIGLQDEDTDLTLRRFAHRSIREYLVAEHVAGLPVASAADILLPHLWYDADWEYAAPMALAMHQQRDQLLEELITRSAGPDALPVDTDLSLIDAGWEFRRFLARAAAESEEQDWTPQSAATIGRARMELAQARLTADLGGAASWEASNRQARDVIIEMLDSQRTDDSILEMVGSSHSNDAQTAHLAMGMLLLTPAASDVERVEIALAQRLNRSRSPAARLLVDAMVQVCRSVAQEQRCGELLLDVLRRQPAAAHIVDWHPTTHVPGQRSAVWRAVWLADGLVRLQKVTPELLQAARDLLLGLLDREPDVHPAAELADVLIRLSPSVDEQHRAGQAIVRLLQKQASGSSSIIQMYILGASVGPAFFSSNANSNADILTAAFADSKPTSAEIRSAGTELLAKLQAESEWSHKSDRLASGYVRMMTMTDSQHLGRELLLEWLEDQPSASAAVRIAHTLPALGPTAAEEARARRAIGGLLTDAVGAERAAALVAAVAQMNPSSEERRQARSVLLGMLGSQPHCWMEAKLASALTHLDPTPEDRHLACSVLLGVLSPETDMVGTLDILEALVWLNPDAQGKHQARQSLRALLSQPQRYVVRTAQSAAVLARLDPSADEAKLARTAMLDALSRADDTRYVGALIDQLLEYGPDPLERAAARESLIRLLGTLDDDSGVNDLVASLVRLGPTEHDRQAARAALLGLLTGPMGGLLDGEVPEQLAMLAFTAEEKLHTRNAIRELMCSEDYEHLTEELADAMVVLDPTANDLSVLTNLKADSRLLPAARRSSALTSWLAALPALAPLIRPAA
jgi:hypothetical protein